MPETDILARPDLHSLLLVVALLLLSCTDLSEYDRVQIQEALADSLISTTESSGVSIRFFEKEKLKLQIEAGQAETINNAGENRTRFSGNVDIVIYDDSLRAATKVNARRAMYYPNRSEFELFEGVSVLSSDSSHLRSEYLKWERKSGTISTPEFVVIVTRSDSISGSGFTGKDDLSEYSIAEGSGVTTINNN
jgi:LPS export ABC transporter protein LptC